MSELRVTGRRLARAALTAAAVLGLAACSSQPKPRAMPPESLEAVNRLLAERFSDVTLSDGIVLHSLRDVSVTSERLRWTNDEGQLRDMPIAPVVRIVARNKKNDLPDPDEPAMGTPAPGSVGGATGAAVGVAYGVIALAAGKVDEEDPGEVIYEGPVTRYLPAAPVPDLPPG